MIWIALCCSIAAGLSCVSQVVKSSRHCLDSKARADVAMRARSFGCSRVRSQRIGAGGGPIAPLGARYATGCMYMNPLTSAGWRWSRSSP